MKIWGSNRDWLQRHDSRELLYTVAVRFTSRSDRDEVWNLLTAEHAMDTGAVLLGGAALSRQGTDRLTAISGGEDALDSLEDCLDATLADAVERCGVGTPSVVLEVREVPDEDALRP